MQILDRERWGFTRHTQLGASSEDIEEQHGFGLAKLLYYLREYGHAGSHNDALTRFWKCQLICEGGIAACSTQSVEEAGGEQLKLTRLTRVAV